MPASRNAFIPLPPCILPMLGKLLLLALALAGAYFLFFLPPQQPPQEQGANPVQPADPACPLKLADLKQEVTVAEQQTFAVKP